MNKIYKRNYYYKHITANKILIIFNNFKFKFSIIILLYLFGIIYYYIYSV